MGGWSYEECADKSVPLERQRFGHAGCSELVESLVVHVVIDHRLIHQRCRSQE